MKRKERISKLKYAILERLMRLLMSGCIGFGGRIIEDVRVKDGLYLAETKKVRFRELNARYHIARYRKGSKSWYDFNITLKQMAREFNRLEPK